MRLNAALTAVAFDAVCEDAYASAVRVSPLSPSVGTMRASIGKAGTCSRNSLGALNLLALCRRVRSDRPAEWADAPTPPN